MTAQLPGFRQTGAIKILVVFFDKAIPTPQVILTGGFQFHYRHDLIPP